MNLGIVCQKASTGGVRYAVMLATGIRSVAPSVSVTFHYGRKVLTQAIRAELEAAGVSLQRLGRVPRARTPRFLRPKRYLNWPPADRVINTLRLAVGDRADRRRRRAIARSLDRHDVVHFAWPYDFDPPPLRVAVSFIPHDFIFGHEFGVPCYDRDMWDSTRVVIGRWVECGAPIVSSDFVASEFARVFPEARRAPEVIYLSSLHPARTKSSEAPGRPQETCRRLGVSGRFMLCPNNLMPHKNLSLLIAALWHLREAGEDVRLVVVGPETQGIRARVNCALYGDRVDSPDNWHVLGLGLVSDEDLLDLMRESLLVVNPSLCEAGSGSALDAWGCGCPVVLADIPAFRDQVRYLGTKTDFFDPRDPRDAARVLCNVIRDPERRAANTTASQAAIERYGWREVARRYLAVFEGLSGKATDRA